MSQPSHIRVRVPASTSNLGPGFDALGLALDLGVTVSVSPASAAVITTSGEGAALLPRGPDNLVLRRMSELAAASGRSLPPIALHIENGIPLERGLGASGAASLAGLLAANALLATGLEREQILDLACQLEGHPDNVTPSLLGGCTVSALSDGHVSALQIPFPDDLVCALCIPDVRMPTHAARQVMPQSYSRADAVFNLSRTALLVAALATGQYAALTVATQDRLHQSYRTTIFPALTPMIEAACAAGAYGAFLSGAGSTIAALSAPARVASVLSAMATVGAEHGLACRTLAAHIDRVGARVETTP
jgi:homoserine kinase